MNETQRELLEWALRYLGRSTQHRSCVSRGRNKICGLSVAATITGNSSFGLYEVDTAAANLWIDSEHHIPTLEKLLKEGLL